MILLTDEERREEWHKGCVASKDIIVAQQNIAKAQLKKVYDWGDEPCPHHQLTSAKKRDCCICTMGIWQALVSYAETH